MVYTQKSVAELFNRKGGEAGKKLPEQVRAILLVLIEEIKKEGPFRSTWKNFSKLSNNKYHCHLKKGYSTYVECWEMVDKKINIVEVYYVGTHEKAPY